MLSRFENQRFFYKKKIKEYVKAISKEKKLIHDIYGCGIEGHDVTDKLHSCKMIDLVSDLVGFRVVQGGLLLKKNSFDFFYLI